MSDASRLETVRAALSARGYDVEQTDRGAVAVPTEEADPVGVAGELAVVPAPTRPVALLEAVASAASRDRTALFVAHPVDAGAVRDVLTDPPGLAAATDGTRTFYSGPDRLHAGDDGLACCRADEPPVWREEPADGVTGDGRRFVLYADGDPVAAFDDLDGLACPSRSAFPYAYRRDEDGRFRVRNLETGRTAGRFGSVGAMRANAYQPVAAPVVPERILDGAYLPEAWALATVEDGRVTELEGA